MSSNLDVRAANARGGAKSGVPVLKVEGTWEKILLGRGKAALEVILPGILRSRRWFGGKGKRIRSAVVTDRAAIEYRDTTYFIWLVRIEYEHGTPDTYVLPLSFVLGESGEGLLERDAAGVLLALETSVGTGVVYDAARDTKFGCALLEWIGDQERIQTLAGEIHGIRSSTFEQLKGTAGPALDPALMRAEQSNTSLRFGEQLILKLFRRVDRGVNPDFEIGRFLTENGFANCAPVAGALELREGGSEPSTLAVLQEFVRNDGDAWAYTLKSLRSSCERAIARAGELVGVAVPIEPLLQLVDKAPPEFMEELAGAYLKSAGLLGRRTAEMHLTLASGRGADFAPEAFTLEYKRFLYGSMRELTAVTMDLLRSHIAALRDADRHHAEQLLGREQELLDEFRAVLEMNLDATRIRVHGDYHLGQVLFTGDDFVIIDFEGEPLRPIRERRIKGSPLRDVAGMLRSFQYAGFSVLMEGYNGEHHAFMARFTGAWSAWASAAFMREYLHGCQGASFLPRDRHALATLLNALQLEKAVYELGYEINNRPGWVRMPISGIIRLLDERAEEARGIRRVA